MSIYTWSENKSIAFHYYSFSENANANCNIVSEFIKKQLDFYRINDKMIYFHFDFLHQLIDFIK